MFTNRKNASVKALQTILSNGATKGKPGYRFAHNVSCYTAKDSDDRPGRHNFSQDELMSMFPRNYGGHCGATKRTHTDYEGEPLQHIVVKRFKRGGWVFHGEGTGNQLIDEIRCWLRFELSPESDYLCPILKYFTCKSDKVGEIDEKMKDKVVIIAQKAVYVDDMASCCAEAERRNMEEGYWNGESAFMREYHLKTFANDMGWRDVEHNPGNSGVIFDYAKGCYKAVFIDYAL